MFFRLHQIMNGLRALCELPERIAEMERFVNGLIDQRYVAVEVHRARVNELLEANTRLVLALRESRQILMRCEQEVYRSSRSHKAGDTADRG